MPTTHATQTRVSEARPAQAKDGKKLSPQVLTELKAARSLASFRDARVSEAALQDGTTRPEEVAADQRAAWKLIEHWATKNGLDDDKFETIRAQSQAELQRIANERQAAAVAQSGSMLQSFKQAIEGKRKSFETLIAAAPPVQPAFVTLDSPYQIWATQGLAMPASTIVPWNSFAKVSLNSSRTSGYEEVGFDFAWENPSDRYAVINVDGYLVFSGVIEATQPGGFWPGDRFARLWVKSTMRTYEWWNDPPTQPLAQSDQSLDVDTVAASDGGFGDVGAIVTRNVFRGVDLRRTLFVLPPHGLTVIEVIAVLQYQTGSDGGRVKADFNSGDLRIMSPFVLIGVLT